MATMDQLNRIMRDYDRRIQSGVRELAANAAVECAVVMAEETPVDTGLARSNWITTIGSPAASVNPPYAPGSGLGKSEQANLEGVYRQAQNMMQAYRTRLGNSYPNLHITNNVDYIGELNRGSSPQSKPGWVERNIDKVLVFIRGNSKLLVRAAAFATQKRFS